MEKYSLSFLDKVHITTVFLLFTGFLFISRYMFPTILIWKTANDFFYFAVWLILASFWLYLLITLFNLAKNKYAAIAINSETNQIILYEDENKFEILPFDSIDSIEVEKGFVVKHVDIYQIKIVSKNKTFIVNTSRIGNFCEELPEEMNVDIKQKFFFIARVSK